MSTVKDHIAKLRRLRADLPGLSLALAQDYGDTSVALRKEDSIDNGINKDGREGSKVIYSDKKIPTYLFQNKALNQGGRDYIKNNPLGNWYGLRQAEGLHNKQVNLTHSGDTWKGYKVLGVSIKAAGVASIRVGLLTSEAAKVFDYNVKRYGKFYLNTPTEMARLRENVREESANWLKTYLS